LGKNILNLQITKNVSESYLILLDLRILFSI